MKSQERTTSVLGVLRPLTYSTHNALELSRLVYVFVSLAVGHRHVKSLRLILLRRISISACDFHSPLHWKYNDTSAMFYNALQYLDPEHICI